MLFCVMCIIVVYCIVFYGTVLYCNGLSCIVSHCQKV